MLGEDWKPEPPALTLPPTALWVSLIAGILAGRFGYLMGGILGLFDGTQCPCCSSHHQASG